MDPGKDRKFLYMVMMVLCLLTTMIVSGDSSKNANNKKAVKIATLLQPPLVMKDSESGEYSGFMIDVLKAIGYEIDSVHALDDRAYGIEEVPDKVTAVLAEVTSGKSDLAIVARTKKSHNASGGITFSHPVYNLGFMPIFKTPGKWTPDYSAMLTLIEPFSPGLWCLIIAFCVLTSGVLFLIRYLSPFEASKKDRSVPSKSNLMYTIGSLLGQDHREAPRSFSGRVLTCVWWVFSLMTAGAYVAGLVTIIFRMNPQINTLPFSSLDEMVRQDEVKVLVVKDSVTYDYIKDREGKIWKMFKNQMDRLVVDSMDTALKLVRESDGKHAILLQETTANYLLNEPPCNLMEVTEPFGDLFYGFACKQGAALCDELENGILHLQETGKIDDLESEYYEGQCYRGEEYNYQGLPFVDTFGVGDPTWLTPMTLTIKRFASAFILLTAGFGTAILVLIAEVLYARWRGPQFFPPKGHGLNDTQRIADQELTPPRDL